MCAAETLQAARNEECDVAKLDEKAQGFDDTMTFNSFAVAAMCMHCCRTCGPEQKKQAVAAALLPQGIGALQGREGRFMKLNLLKIVVTIPSAIALLTSIWCDD